MTPVDTTSTATDTSTLVERSLRLASQAASSSLRGVTVVETVANPRASLGDNVTMYASQGIFLHTTTIKEGDDDLVLCSMMYCKDLSLIVSK